jgi:DNA (cytosine-5)-methyltransferase 1
MTVRDYFGKNIDTNYYYRHPRNYSRRAIYSIDEASPAIRGVNRPIPKGYPGHPGDPVAVSESVRPLTTLERSQIQTFPKDFVRAGNKTEIEQMIGNAVPANLAKFVALAIIDYYNTEVELK